MRIDLPRRPSARRATPLWLLALPTLSMLVLGMSLPLLGADAFDQFMSARGWRPGEPRSTAIEAWLRSARRPQVDLPTLRFDIRFKHYKRLLDKRAAALRLGRLHSSNADFIPGKLRFEGREMGLKLRLQGDDVAAIRGDKWPIRVRVRGGDHVLGMERFTLRPPRADGYYDKALAYAALRDVAIVPRYQFVRVIVNGKHLGVVGMEEYLSNELIEANKRPPGPILRISSASVLPADATATAARSTVALVADLGAARSEVIRAGRWQKSPERRRIARRAIMLLDHFLAHRVRASQALDPTVTPKFLSAVEGIGAPQLLRWDNLRWYFNPILDRLEPIAYAADSVIRSDAIGLVRQSTISAQILADPVMSRGLQLATAPAPTLPPAIELSDEFPMATFDTNAVRRRFKRTRRLIDAALPAPPTLPSEATSSVQDAIAERRPLALGPGRVRVDEDIRLPLGVSLIVAPGTTVEIGPRASIVVRGDAWIGEVGAVKTRLVVLTRPSHARFPLVFADGHLRIHNTLLTTPPNATLSNGRPRRELDAMPKAALTVHRAVVHINDLTASDIEAEAAVAMYACRGRVESLRVRDCSGDALALVHDVDLEVSAEVQNCAGDGIDVRGGSKIKIRDARLRSIGDKATSVGGGADVTVHRLAVQAAAVGLAVKDGSHVKVTELTTAAISGASLVTFTKKSRFGEASCSVVKHNHTGGERRVVRHAGTMLRIGDVPVAKTPGSLDQLYKLGWLGAR